MKDHQARVKVTDEVWTDFREATRNRSVAIALGDLVAREVDRYRARRVREGSADEQELLEALERAQELHAELAALVKRLERRLELRAGQPR
jgi:predicted metal-dependent hydrolase